VECAWRERELCLEDAVRPCHRDEVDLREAAGAERQRLQALAGTGLQAIGRKRRPSRIGARGDLGADPRCIRANPVAARIAARERQGDEWKTSRSRAPQQRRAGGSCRHADDRRSVRGVERGNRPACDRRSLLGEQQVRATAGGEGQHLQMAVHSRSDKIQMAIAVDIGERQLRRVGKR
jgi:hypothetical protein